MKSFERFISTTLWHTYTEEVFCFVKDGLENTYSANITNRGNSIVVTFSILPHKYYDKERVDNGRSLKQENIM